MSRNLTIVVIAAVILLVLGLSSTFIVQQTEQAIVLRFGNPVRVINQPGLKFRLPIAETVVKYDKRVLDSDPAAARRLRDELANRTRQATSDIVMASAKLNI